MNIQNNQFTIIYGAKNFLGDMINMNSIVLINNSFQNVSIL